MVRRCSLHYGRDESKEHITLFNEKSLLKCSETLKTRKRLGIKYSDFELPSSVDGESGFHISCYRRFSALSQSTHIKIKRKSPKKKLVSCVRRSEIKSPSPATTSGVLEKLCLFCCQKSKKKNNKWYTLVNCVTDEFKKISINLQCSGQITDYWLKYKIFASQQKKFVTIASVVWNMKTLLKQHRLRRKSCH